MYPGIWIGKNVESAKQKVLILGESHYVSDYHNNQDAIGKVPFTTRSIVESYLNDNISNGRWDFFTKIAKTFGYNTEEEICKFYDLVYFGNYVNVLVDKKHRPNGKDFIAKNNSTYNKELFDFCVNFSIDIVACFSKEAYDSLPMEGNKQTDGIYSIQRENNYPIKQQKWLYEKGTLENMSLILDNNLLVYGFYHPSWPRYYDANLVFNEYTKKQQELKWLCNES
ncbi:MAG: hypothetical protein IKN12_03595 [Selenomonadaceae bacterium]|nr:hypothetical protein [Selenomonadaceae bacterium]